MQPGLSRAFPMAIVGFLLGALFVILIRGLQALDPVWNPGLGIVMGVLFAAGFFVWGMGAFDPKMSVHSEHADDPHDAHDAQEKPVGILASSIWQISAGLAIVVIALLGFASLPGGLTLRTTNDPIASASMIGFQELHLADVAHLLVLLITPLILLGWVLLLITLAWLLFFGPLKPKEGLFMPSVIRFMLLLAPAGNAFLASALLGIQIPGILTILLTVFLFWLLYLGPLRPRVPGTWAQTWRFAALLVGLLALQLILPFWFDTAAPFRTLPIPLVVATIPQASSVYLTDFLRETLINFFQTDALFVSELVYFILFILFTLISLLIVGAILALVFYVLVRGVAESKAEGAAIQKREIPARPGNSLERVIGTSAGWLAKALRRVPGSLQ